jgi:hypothetical protein
MQVAASVQMRPNSPWRWQASRLIFETHDLSDSDCGLWQRLKEVAEQLRAEFEAGGNSDLTRLGEADAVLSHIPQNRDARYLDHVRA